MHRLSTQLLVTRKEPPAEARTPGHALLLRAGQLEHTDDGVVVGALLQRVLRRLRALTRGEVEAAGGQEVGLVGVPGSAAQAVTAFAASRVSSHRQLPQVLFAFGSKAEAPGGRGRLGSKLLGGGADTVAWAQAFDADEGAAEASYQALAAACERVVTRCGLNAVRADAGDQVGEQLVALVDAGDEVVAVSDAGSYAAAVHVARADLHPPGKPDGDAPMTEVPTPGAATLSALRESVPDVPPERTIKTLLYHALLPGGDSQLVAALCRGDRSVDEAKLTRALGAVEVGMGDAAAVEQATGAAVGYAGPVELPAQVRVVADHAVADVDGFVCGANRTDAHLRDVRWGRDVALPELADLDLVQDGDRAPDGGTLRLRRGVEVARTCRHGAGSGEVAGVTGVAGVTAAGPDGTDHPVWATSCRLDVAQLAASVVEQHHDERGLAWPAAVAPHTVVVVTVRPDDEDQRRLAEQVGAELETAGVDVVWDDRDARAGAKFADAELLGFPWRITCGRDAAEGRVELVSRAAGEPAVLDAGEAVRRVADATREAGVPPLGRGHSGGHAAP